MARTENAAQGLQDTGALVFILLAATAGATEMAQIPMMRRLLSNSRWGLPCDQQAPAEPWATEEGLFTLAGLLRAHKGGLPSHVGREHEKRVEFFKGEELVAFLLREDGNVRVQFPQLTTRDQAFAVGRTLLQMKYVHRSSPDVKYPTMLKPCADEADEFVSQGLYTWDYELKSQVNRDVKEIAARSLLNCVVM